MHNAPTLAPYFPEQEHAMSLTQYLRAKKLWPQRAELPAHKLNRGLREAMVETGEQLAREMEPMKFKLGARSVARLAGVHPDLRKVVERAIELTEVDFTVLEGLRTKTRQRQLYNSGASQTMRSRHLTGHAVDLGAYVGGKVSWDWPLYYKIADAMKAAAKELGVPIEWGGDWRSFKDGPHYQLPWRKYPE